MSSDGEQQLSRWSVLILGIAQDGGYPQCGCGKPCCLEATTHHCASSLAVVYLPSGGSTPEVWLFDASPDLREQHGHLQRRLQEVHGSLRFQSPYFREDQATSLRGVFLTHAHIGHYTGLTMFGREAMDAKQLPLYCAPQMHEFLKNNGPWNQLLSLGQLAPVVLQPSGDLSGAPSIELQPSDGTTPLPIHCIPVPHRSEYSETYGFVIGRHTLYLPDVDHLAWDIDEVLRGCKRAFLDGTFFDAHELPGRDLSKIPHPFVADSMVRLADFSDRISFIHLNHTNPLLWSSAARDKVKERGFSVACEHTFYSLSNEHH